MNSPGAYFGGKGRLVPHIIAQFPVRMDAYIEPYFGMGAVFFAAPIRWAKDEIINDANRNVVNFFEVLRDHPAKLARALTLTPSARTEFYDAEKKLLDKRTGKLERARCFFISIEQSFSNTHRGWKLPTGDHVRDWTTKTKPERLMRIAERLRMAGIENYPALKVIDLYDRPGRLFYLDPPYIVDDQKRMSDIDESYSGHGMNQDEHKKLVDRLLKIQGMAILSGYAHPVYKPLEVAGWKTVNIKMTTQIFSSKKTSKDKTRIETLWINPSLQAANKQKMLF